MNTSVYKTWSENQRLSPLIAAFIQSCTVLLVLLCFSHRVRSGLDDAITRATRDASVKAVVVIGKGQTFPSGADIKEFGKPIEGVENSKFNVKICFSE